MHSHRLMSHLLPKLEAVVYRRFQTLKQLNRAAKIKDRIEKLETKLTGLLGIPGADDGGRGRPPTAPDVRCGEDEDCCGSEEAVG